MPSREWLVVVATARGASHEAAGTPNQDAVHSVGLECLGPGAVVAAVSDGHGDRRHFRSDRGARFAVEAACRCSAELAGRLKRLDDARELERFAVATLVPTILEHWRSAVNADMERTPFTHAEATRRAARNDAPVVAYGATLLVAVGWREWLLLTQIGDGDVIVMRPDGEVTVPIPPDPSLDGLRTTSLCQASALGAFRVAVIDRSFTDLAGVLLATDGFGNAQAVDRWEGAVGADLVKMIRTQGVEWVATQLPEWLVRCASSEGSADDATVALLVEQVGQ
jgi:serine/threonine protein phosphatase PrpC